MVEEGLDIQKIYIQRERERGLYTLKRGDKCVRRKKIMMEKGKKTLREREVSFINNQKTLREGEAPFTKNSNIQNTNIDVRCFALPILKCQKDWPTWELHLQKYVVNVIFKIVDEPSFRKVKKEKRTENSVELVSLMVLIVAMQILFRRRRILRELPGTLKTITYSGFLAYSGYDP